MPSARVHSHKSPLIGANVTNINLSNSITSTKRQKRASTQQKPVLHHDVEVIEISDDEMSTPITAKHSHADLRRQLAVLQGEINRYKAELAAAHKELEKLRAPEPIQGKLVLDLSQLEDNINCGICTIRLWHPYILPGCGHTFCQSCLQDWFNTTLAQFMQSHPGYIPGVHANAHGVWEVVMRNPRAHNDPYIAHTHPGNPHPEYTCPTCRVAVVGPPPEDFTLKELVRVVTKAAGETSPKRQGASAKNPWDGFFPNSSQMLTHASIV